MRYKLVVCVELSSNPCLLFLLWIVAKMASVQSAMSELRILKQEEATMINLASKVSDQLNRLKVEELALQNMVRLQNEELERRSRASKRSVNRSVPTEEEFESVKGNYSDDDDDDDIVPLDLFVHKHGFDERENIVEEEEEEDEDEPTQEVEVRDIVDNEPEDIEQFVNSL